MIISQFDYRMYQDEIAELREEMTQLLLSMEMYHQTRSREEFDRWWIDEGRQRKYFSCKRRVEQIQNFLAFAQVEEQEHPRMRPGGRSGPR
jgi:hypothetical protein